MIVLSPQADLDSQAVACLAGSAVNQDGRSSGLTAPNGPSQTRLIKRALAAAELVPVDLTYLAVHGTGHHLCCCLGHKTYIKHPTSLNRLCVDPLSFPRAFLPSALKRQLFMQSEGFNGV